MIANKEDFCGILRTFVGLTRPSDIPVPLLEWGIQA
jgi:hypothetical protein